MTRGDTAARIAAYQRYARSRQQGGRYPTDALVTIVAFSVVALVVLAAGIQQLTRRAEWTWVDFARGALTMAMLAAAAWAIDHAMDRR